MTLKAFYAQKSTRNNAGKIINFTFLEHLEFLIEKVCWQVTKIYLHYTFKQKKFKKEFILINKKSKQEATNSFEKVFFKLLGNSNFGYDFRNNIGHCTFEITYELGEISYLKKYSNIFNNSVSAFVNSETLEYKIEK